MEGNRKALIVSSNLKERDIAVRTVLGIEPQLFSDSIEDGSTDSALLWLTYFKDIALIFVFHGSGVDGILLLREARKLYPELPYVFVSDIDDEKFYIDFCKEFGRGIYFVKGDPKFAPTLLRFEIEKMFYLH